MGTGDTPNIGGSGVGDAIDPLGTGRRRLPLPDGFVGDNANNPLRQLGSLAPGNSGGGDAITGIGPDANDSDSGDDGSGGSSASGIGKLFGFLGPLFAKSGGSGGGGGNSTASTIFGFLGSLFKMGSSLIPHADGGSVSPSSAYLVGERGPEILTGASGNITSNAASRRMLGNSTGNTAYYSIDARGTDPVLTEQRTRTAILAAHNSAISNAVQVNAERLKRTPQRA